ncbi:MAG: FkbM family methyltransferase [Candidatus Paceibacterota bacterium]
MKDYYTICKNLVPKRVRTSLKPLYLRWSLRSFKEPQYVTVKNYGFSILLDPINGAVDQYVYMHRNWETRIATLLERELRHGDTFVDVGANIGCFTFPGALFVGATGHVIAFEPIVRLAKQIASSVARNNFQNVSIQQMAVGREQGVGTLSLVPGNIGGSSLVKENTSGMFETVAVSTLDAELSSCERVDLIKIDVEGYELEVLEGARHILQKHTPKLILEFSPNVYRKRDPGIARSILMLLREMGYVIRDIERNVHVENIDTYLEQLGRDQTNLFAVATHKVAKRV